MNPAEKDTADTASVNRRSLLQVAALAPVALAAAGDALAQAASGRETVPVRRFEVIAGERSKKMR